MKNTGLILILTICFVGVLSAQDKRIKLMRLDQNKKIQLTLLENKIYANPDGFDVKVCIANKTDTAFILYGFNDVWNGGVDKESYSTGDITAASELICVDKDDKWFRMKLDGGGQRLMLQQKRRWTEVVALIRDSKIVIPGKSSQEITLHIKIEKGTLEKDIYRIRMVYYCGYNIVNVVDKEVIAKDESRLNAMLYQGFAESNIITIVSK